MLDARSGFVSAASAAPPTDADPPAPIPPTMIAAHAIVVDGAMAATPNAAAIAIRLTRPRRWRCRPARGDSGGGEAGDGADQQRCGQNGTGSGFGDTEVLDHCHDHQGDEVRGDEPHDADTEDGNTAVGGEWNPVGLRIRRSVDRH